MIFSKIIIISFILIISYTLYSYIKSYNEIVDELKKIREKCVIDSNQEQETNIKEEKESFSKDQNKKGKKQKKKEKKIETEEINTKQTNNEGKNTEETNTERTNTEETNTERTNTEETNIESFENFSNEKYIDYWKPYTEDINKTSEGFQDSPYKGYNKYLYE
jgi:hypothetical protein